MLFHKVLIKNIRYFFKALHDYFKCISSLVNNIQGLFKQKIFIKFTEIFRLYLSLTSGILKQ